MSRTMLLTAALLLLASMTHYQVASAITRFQANLSAAQVVNNPTSTTATGIALFELSDDQTRLSYTLELDGLDLDPDMGSRTDPNDVNKIHLHDAPTGSTGPHVLNIFGLPREDDSQLIVDDAMESLSGEWDDDDAINPDTNMLFDQGMPGTTKLLSSFVDELLAGELYIAVHTVEVGGDVAIRGQLTQIPEPTGLLLAGCAILLYFSRARYQGNEAAPS